MTTIISPTNSSSISSNRRNHTSKQYHSNQNVVCRLQLSYIFTMVIVFLCILFVSIIVVSMRSLLSYNDSSHNNNNPMMMIDTTDDDTLHHHFFNPNYNKKNSTGSDSSSTTTTTTTLQKQLRVVKKRRLLPSFTNGGVIIFFHIAETGGEYIRTYLKGLQLQFDNTNTNKNTVLDVQLMHNPESAIQLQKYIVQHLRSTVRNPILFIEIHGDVPGFMYWQRKLYTYREIAKTTKKAFFTFTVVNEPVHFHLYYYNHYIVPPCIPDQLEEQFLCEQQQQNENQNQQQQELQPMNDENNQLSSSTKDNTLLLLEQSISNHQCMWLSRLSHVPNQQETCVTAKECRSTYILMKDHLDYIGTTNTIHTIIIPLLIHFVFDKFNTMEDMTTAEGSSSIEQQQQQQQRMNVMLPYNEFVLNYTNHYLNKYSTHTNTNSNNKNGILYKDELSTEVQLQLMEKSIGDYELYQTIIKDFFPIHTLWDNYQPPSSSGVSTTTTTNTDDNHNQMIIQPKQ